MRDLFIEIWESIRRNKLRTCLTGFAVAWGIFMLIVLLGAGNGAMNSLLGNLGDFQSNTMQMGGGWTSKPYDGLKQDRRIRLSDKDMDLIVRAFPDIVDDINATVSKGGLTMNYGKRHFEASLTGVFPAYGEMNDLDLIAGRFINAKDISDKRKVIVINTIQARNFMGGNRNYNHILGKKVKFGNMLYTVVGVRKGYDNEYDVEDYVPYNVLKTIYGMDNEVGEITFSFHGLKTEKENEEFEKKLKAIVNTAHRAAPDDERATWIWNRFTQEMQANKGKRIFSIALWVIGIFTLLSGIVGVSNIMLITVKERTHEFGIRKAIGASPWSITKLIIAESVSITAFFGYVGMILGLIACEVLDATVGQNALDVMGTSIKMLDNPTVGVDTAVGATVLLIVAGTIAGLFPARKAAKVRPIEALRAD